MTSRKLMGATGLVIAAVFLLTINILSNTALRGARMDLTDGRLYTLTQGTKNIVSTLDEPITLRFFFSEKLATRAPGLNDYARRVRELLMEYAESSNGNLRLELIDPEPFSEEEEMAVRAGLQGVPVSQQERLFFGLQGVNAIDGKATIPFFTPEREEYLEYDVSKLVFDLAHPERRKVSVITSLPMDGDMDPMAAMMGQQAGSEPWIIYENLRELYDVQRLEPQEQSVPEDTDVLLIVHPKEMTDQLKYSIDQYVLRGGKTIVFVDPLAEIEEPPQNPQNPLQSMSVPRSSNMPELLEAWGVRLVDGKVLGDRQRAQQVMVGSQNRPELVSYILYVGLRDEDINREEIFTKTVENINVASAGILEKIEGATTTVSPLIQSSEDSSRIDVMAAQMFPDPKKMLAEFSSQGKRELIAARITGKARSAFPDGLEENETGDAHLAEARESLNVAVFADVDLLSDRTWVQMQRMFNLRIPRLMASNGDMVINLVDYMSGSEDLISIRGRGRFQRPFTRVEAMEAAAAAKSAEKVRELEQKLEETKQRLRELQREAPDGSGAMIASSDLRREIERFELQEVQTARELRRVELEKRQEVEKLERRLKFLNMGLIPLLVGVVAVGMGAVRVSRRRRR